MSPGEDIKTQAEVVPAAAAPVSVAPAPAAATTPAFPPGPPTGWTLEQIAAAAGISIDAMAADIARLQAQNGVVGLAGSTLLHVFESHVNPGQVAAALSLVLQGLAKAAIDGHGEVGHSDAELA